jgi:hypothetical protein
MEGITGISANSLGVGQQKTVNQLRFIMGSNSYLATEPGRIFVTDLGLDATSGQLNQIGVFGDKQNFVIQFSEEEAFLLNGVRVTGELPERGIFSIPGGITLKGTFLVARIRS